MINSIEMQAPLNRSYNQLQFIQHYEFNARPRDDGPGLKALFFLIDIVYILNGKIKQLIYNIIIS